MQCRACNYPDSRVVETRKDINSNQLRRRRECIKCGARFTTQELIRQKEKPSDYTTTPPKKILDR
jgi:transcriptional regulator NrdR family protein